jgi:hypothetical protein
MTGWPELTVRLEQLGQSAGEGPGIRESFSAVIVGEDEDGVIGQAIGMDRFDHTPNLEIQSFDHLLIDSLGSAVEVIEVAACKALRFRVVSRRLRFS